MFMPLDDIQTTESFLSGETATVKRVFVERAVENTARHKPDGFKLPYKLITPGLLIHRIFDRQTNREISSKRERGRRAVSGASSVRYWRCRGSLSSILEDYAR